MRYSQAFTGNHRQPADGARRALPRRDRDGLVRVVSTGPERPDEIGVRKAGGGPSVLLLPPPDRAAGPEPGEAVDPADVVAELLQAALQCGNVGTVEPADLSPAASEPPVAIGYAV